MVNRRRMEYRPNWDDIQMTNRRQDEEKPKKQYVLTVRAFKKCSQCGHYNIPTDRRYFCSNCKLSIHRDVNAAKNIMMKGYIEQTGEDGPQNITGDDNPSKNPVMGIEYQDIINEIS